MPVTMPDIGHNVTLAGNTAGVLTQISTGTLTIAGGNNITLSQNGNAITISGPNVGGAQTGISGLANSETTYTSGSVTLSALGAITIRSTTGQHFQFSVNAQTVESNTIGMSNIGNTSGDTAIRSAGQLQIVLAGGNNVTLSQSTAGSSATITISAANETQTVPPIATTVQSVATANSVGTVTRFAPEDHRHVGIAQAQISGNTSNTSNVILGSLVLAGGNNITLSQVSAAGAATITISAFNQTVESNTIGMSNIGNTSGDTAIRSGPQLQIVFAGGNNITLSQSTNGSSATVTISAFNQTSPVVGSAIQSVSSATNSGAATSKFAAEDHKHAGVGPLGVSTGGNTSGDTGTQYGRVVLAGGNNITLSVSSSNDGAQTISISAPNLGAGAGFTAGMSNLGNTKGTTGVADSRLIIVGGNNITISQSLDAASHSGTITISQDMPRIGWWEWPPGWWRYTSGGTAGVNTFLISPFAISGNLSASSVFLMLSMNGGTSSAGTNGVTIPIGVYTQQTGASSSRLSLLASAQFTTSWTSGTTATAGTDWGGYLAFRRWAIPLTVNLTPGQYWVGAAIQVTGSVSNPTWAGIGANQNISSGVAGATAVSRHMVPFAGNFASTTLTAPDSILSNQIVGAGGNQRVLPWVAFGDPTLINFDA